MQHNTDCRYIMLKQRPKVTAISSPILSGMVISFPVLWRKILWNETILYIFIFVEDADNVCVSRSTSS